VELTVGLLVTEDVGLLVTEGVGSTALGILYRDVPSDVFDTADRTPARIAESVATNATTVIRPAYRRPQDGAEETEGVPPMIEIAVNGCDIAGARIYCIFKKSGFNFIIAQGRSPCAIIKFQRLIFSPKGAKN